MQNPAEHLKSEHENTAHENAAPTWKKPELTIAHVSTVTESQIVLGAGDASIGIYTS